MENESTSDVKRERFQRVAERRTQKIIDRLNVLGNCGNTSNYAYTDAEVKKIFDTIRGQVDEVEKKFMEKTHGVQRFSLDRSE